MMLVSINVHNLVDKFFSDEESHRQTVENSNRDSYLTDVYQSSWNRG